jgi:hemoglobin
MGGAEAIAQLVERFYFHMNTRPEAALIRDMHAADLDEIKRVLRLYLAEWMGGPGHYTAERGHPRLRMRHARFAIDTAARDAWMTCMRLALAEVVADEGIDEGLRTELEEKFFKLADFLRNTPTKPEAGAQPEAEPDAKAEAQPMPPGSASPR